jgi:hypothetical protein
MPRKRRDEETILAFWKQFARDKDCPWSVRIYCTFALAVATKMLPPTMPPPGVARYRPERAAVEPPPPAELDDSPQPRDMSDFASQLKNGGNDGGS